MAMNVSYEILSKTRGKSLVESISQDRKDAIKRAEEIVARGRVDSVKVIEEKENTDTGDVVSTVVFTKDKGSLGGKPGAEKKKRGEDRRKNDDRRDEKKKKKKKAGFVDLLVKMCLSIYSVLITIGLVICMLAK